MANDEKGQERGTLPFKPCKIGVSKHCNLPFHSADMAALEHVVKSFVQNVLNPTDLQSFHIMQCIGLSQGLADYNLHSQCLWNAVHLTWNKASQRVGIALVVF